MNCWELKKCEREPGGAKVAEFGVCPAASMDAGDACWLIAGTFCGGSVQGTFAQKEANCISCDHYASYGMRHRTKMRKKFAS